MQIETGDLLLFHGTGWISRTLEWVGCSKYSHVGILVKNPSFLHAGLEDGWYVLDSSWGSIPDKEDNTIKFGVQLHRLDEVMSMYDPDSIFVRKIVATRDAEWYKKFKEVHDMVFNKPYDTHIVDWIMASLQLRYPIPISPLWKNTTRFWCSSLVSFIYLQLGWISDVNWTLIAPREYSSTESTGQVLFTCIINDECQLKEFLTTIKESSE
jgi:hypothetical protein